MKIRINYVTNSSSSSFILGFYSEETIQSELQELIGSGYFEEVYKDCVNAEKMQLSQMLETAKKEMRWNIRIHIEEEKQRTSNMSWEEMMKWKKSNEFESLVKDRIQQRLNEIKKAAEGKHIFLHISYSDSEGDGELEHYIVPNLNTCLAVFTHH